jgi:acetyl esterase/lipase
VTSILKACLGLLLLSISPVSPAQQVIPIWGESSPHYYKENALQEYEAECWLAVCAHQIVHPTLTLFRPGEEGVERTNDNVVVVLPGGGYEVEAIYHEGFEIARALALQGTVAGVLKYRLPNPQSATRPEQVPLSDVRQAIHLLRSRQEQFGIVADRIGVLGFSAGSHLATAASVNRVEESDRNPEFSILVYGVTRMTPENREWLEKTLYHRKMTASEIAEQSLIERVDEYTPPAFLVHALDDDVCHYTESTHYAEALTRHGVAAEMHLFASGGHGFGSGRAEDGTGQWLGLAANWLNRLGREQAGKIPWPLSCDFASFESSREKLGHCAARNADGDILVRPELLDDIAPDSGVQSLHVDGNWLFAIPGKTRVALEFDNGADYFREGLARTVRDGKIGFVNENLDLVIQARWDFAFPFDQGRAVVCIGCQPEADGEHSALVGGKWGYIDRHGDIVVDLVHDRDALPSRPE